MYYDILIDYTTGDSFSSQRVYGESVGIVTSTLDDAKENLKRIKKQYEHYENDSTYRDSLDLLSEDGVRTISPFWIGYFETLHGAKIAPVMDESLGFRV